MAISAQAGKLATTEMLLNVDQLIRDYYQLKPDMNCVEQQVSFGTSGHRGCASLRSFNQAHILAISQAICDYRLEQNIYGPLLLGMDTHALSKPALMTALGVLAANQVEVYLDAGVPETGYEIGFTPTPVISEAIIWHNRHNPHHLADGIVITPSHNPPGDGGIKYNLTNGGPADSVTTAWIEQRANHYLVQQLAGVRQIPFEKALQTSTTQRFDFMMPYIMRLADVVDLIAIQRSNLRLAVDPLGGAGVYYWPRISQHYQLDLQLHNQTVDPTFRFVPLDWDGQIRMDCSSPYVMSQLIAAKDQANISFACDTDHDRFGIVTPSAGLLNANHYLAVASDYLLRHRPWPTQLGIGKTVVSSTMIDRVAQGLNRFIYETPVGIKWFSNGLMAQQLAFAGEESAGATFLTRQGQPWSTDKDGIILGLLAGEITAITGIDPGQYYQQLTQQYGHFYFARQDAAIDLVAKRRLAKIRPEQIVDTELAGAPIEKILTHAPGNDHAFGGIKIITEKGWVAARPSGTEAVYKIYAESYVSPIHLTQLQQAAQRLIDRVVQEIPLP